MSWEGYSQNFCKEGHYFVGSAGYDSEPTHCSCGSEVAYCHIVDDTNCDQVGFIPDEVRATLLLEPEETAVCNLGHVHVTKMAVYKIPTREEARVKIPPPFFYDSSWDAKGNWKLDAAVLDD